MNKKIDVEVVIGGKPYTLSGYESSDYLQRIAMHINGKIAEFRAQEGYARLETELKNVLLAINLSDDYQKAQNTIRELKQDNEDMEKELFDMKHEMISMQRELQEAKDAVKKLVTVALDDNKSIPHDNFGKFGSASVLLKKAPEGTGVIAGGPARAVIEMAGIKNIRTKSLGSNNKQNVVLATIEGLRQIKTPEEVAKLRGKSVEEIFG